VTQVKQPAKAQHRSLTECIVNPGNFLLSDFSKLQRSHLLHIAFQVLEELAAKTGKLPSPGSMEDVEAFIAAFSEFNAALVRLHGAVFCV
jgi:ubiquitin-activating enzyme E1